MLKDTITRGEERRVVSTKLYRSEFVNIMKICEAEKNKSIHQKLRELVQQEINKNLEGADKLLLTKMKEGNEKSEEKIKAKQKQWNFEVKRK